MVLRPNGIYFAGTTLTIFFPKFIGVCFASFFFKYLVQTCSDFFVPKSYTTWFNKFFSFKMKVKSRGLNQKKSSKCCLTKL